MILGTLEVMVGSDRVELPGPRQQVVLAMLLLNAGRSVSMGRLEEAIYGQHPPSTSRSQLHSSVSSLRRLFAAHLGDSVIATHPQGYIIELGDGQLDYAKFRDLIGEAREARDAHQLDEAVAHYREALRLWRGPALDGIDNQLVHEAASHLDEQRIAANEERITLELMLGRHGEVLAELAELVADFPLREQLRGQLMLALYRCSRTADALQAYQQARQTLVDELGIEPSEHLRHLHHAILTSDPSLDLPSRAATPQSPRATAPCLLPADTADFTGRVKQIEEISQRLLTADDGAAQFAVPIVVITGKGGIGKTTAAVHASHCIAEYYPDGQLFADLHGTSEHPTSPMQVLERFMRALGVPGSQMPVDPDERAEAYRDLLASRKVLILLDDAASESQVLPLLPGRASASVIVTSRRRLPGLAGSVDVHLDIFEAQKSLDLLACIAGAERIHDQPRAAAEIAELCGHLPLALRIAGARLFIHPHWCLQQLVDRLADETRRLDELRYGAMGLRASITLTYEGVSERARRLFRLLGVLDLPEFSGWVSAAMLDQPFADAEDILDELVSAQLVETSGAGSDGQDKYRFHDLVRVFARERLAAEETGTDRKTALERVLRALLYLAEDAHRRHYGGDYVRVRSDGAPWSAGDRLMTRLTANPMSWYERERITLMWGVRQAAQVGLTELCWNLAICAVTLYESRSYLDDWRETHKIALEATQQAHDARGEAAMLYSTGSLHMLQQKFGYACGFFENAARVFSDIHDEHGLALVVRHLAFIDRLHGDLDSASLRYEQALRAFRKTGDRVATAHVLQNFAQVMLELGHAADAADALSEALALSRSVNSPRVEAQVLYRMGEAHLLANEPDHAVEVFDQVLAKVRDTGDPIGEAYALRGIAMAKTRLANFDQAHAELQRALVIARTVGERLAEGRILLGLSELAAAGGDQDRAIASGLQASVIFRDIEAPLDEVQVLGVLSNAYTALGEHNAAEDIRVRMLDLREGFTGFK